MENTKFVLNDKAVASPAKSNEESWTDKALREVQLIGQGASGVVDAAKESVSKGHRLETVAELALSAGVGIGLSYLTRGRGMGYLAGRTLAAAGTLSFLKDGCEHGGQALNAMRDAWHSDENMQQDAAIMKNGVGGFVFDAGMMSIGGMAGAKTGHALFKPEIPPLFFDQMSNKTGIRQDYYNQLYGAEWKTNQAIDAKGGLAPEKIAAAKSKLPDTLRGIRTYSDYWDDEITKFEKANPDHAKLDSKGIKNYLVSDRPSAIKLDQLSAEIRLHADQDLNDPQVMNGLIDKFQAGRHVIYGNDPQQARRLIMGPPLTPVEMNALASKNQSSLANVLDRFGFNRGTETTA
jgi:hypothetical protein